MSNEWCASSLEELPPHGDPVCDVIARGAVADVHGPHSGKRLRACFENLHGALAETLVPPHQQHQASHQRRTANQAAMLRLVAGEVSIREAIGEFSCLAKREAKALSGDGVDSARGIAHKDGAIAIHTSQSAADGDGATFAGSMFRTMDPCR